MELLQFNQELLGLLIGSELEVVNLS